MELPTLLSEKASEFPESSYGATTVTLLLIDNRKINNVILAWGSEIIKIENKPIKDIRNIGFKQEDIIDVLQT